MICMNKVQRSRFIDNVLFAKQQELCGLEKKSLSPSIDEVTAHQQIWGFDRKNIEKHRKNIGKPYIMEK